jgi:hypothetical protein
MSFKVAMILDDVTDFSYLEKCLKGIDVEFWRRNCRTEPEIITSAKEADFIITIMHRYPYVGDTESGPRSDILGQASAGIGTDPCLEFPA